MISNSRLACLVVASLFSGLGGAASAQTILEIDGVEVWFGDGEVVQGSPAAPVATTAAAPAESKRAKRFPQLKFDRRPSAILAARAQPPESPEKPVEPAEPSTATPPAPTEAPTDPAEIEKAALAHAEAEKAAAEKAENEALEAEMKAFQRNVTLGEWQAVADYLAGLPEAEGKAGYERLLASLVEGPPRPNSPFANWAEKNFFAAEDLAGLISAAPQELDKARVDALGTLLRTTVEASGLFEPVLAHLRSELASQALGIEPTQLAAILVAANFPIEAGEFLPPLAEAKNADQRATLNLISRHALARHEKEKKAGWLEVAWEALQGVLAPGRVSDEDKAEALKRAVEVAPRIREELGDAWLEESFTARAERGLEILATIGTGSSTGLVDQARNADYRLKSLQLETTAAEALLAKAPELAREWAGTLTLLATNWLREAEYSNQFDTSTSRGPAVQRDPYGNIFYYDWSGQRNNPNQPLALKTAEVLTELPSEAWRALVAASVRARLERAAAQLHLKLGEDRAAFPFIERLAAVHPAPAKALAEEFLTVWIKNHNPNDAQQRTNPYMFMYGFEERLNGIPLTRSKQERNLVELSEWVVRLRALPIGELDEALLARAFTTAHSSAEVYRLETIERVFGALDALGPKTQAELVQTMRANLAGLWREPAEQEEKKTRRRQQDIQAEVLRGYEVARTVAARALEAHPGHWSLELARAAVLHDENLYRSELAPTSEFAPRRAEALEEFARAASSYAAALPELDREEQTTRVYEQWFYAALGACELKDVSHEQRVASDQIERIRAALAGLPGEAARHHEDLFANALFTRLSSVGPAVKYRYLEHGLAIVPTSERTREARSLFDYYRDLVTEIRLETRLDGDARVGSEPFGLFVDLVHTREIEREAGGFGKYLVNQNAQSFSWNYGRPTEDYRDKFEEAARAALGEHFEVQSVTFNSPDAHSRALPEYGWRVTPYAFLLLKARGPEVDRVPPLRLDLDFLDTSGYAVLPVESSPLGIVARERASEPRPYYDLELCQTLDERQAHEQKLVLEVQARAKGLLPELDELLTLAPPGFERVALEDQGLSVSEFDTEGEGVDVWCERTWMVTFQGAAGLPELPSEFQFGTPRDPEAKLVHQRFLDADLASVGPVVALEARYGERARSGRVWLFALPALLVAAFGAWFVARRSTRRARPEARFRVPEPVSAFTVLGLLREIEGEGSLAGSSRAELRATIDALERRYFAAAEGAHPNGEAASELTRLASEWVARVP